MRVAIGDLDPEVAASAAREIGPGTAGPASSAGLVGVAGGATYSASKHGSDLLKRLPRADQVMGQADIAARTSYERRAGS
jgi:hypothetical protein